VGPTYSVRICKLVESVLPFSPSSSSLHRATARTLREPPPLARCGEACVRAHRTADTQPRGRQGAYPISSSVASTHS